MKWLRIFISICIERCLKFFRSKLIRVDKISIFIDEWFPTYCKMIKYSH